MFAAHTAPTVRRHPNEAALRRLLRNLGRQLRRAVELAGAPYADGTLPQL